MNNIELIQEITYRSEKCPTMAPLAYGLICELNKKIAEAKDLAEAKKPVSVAEKYSLSIQEAAVYYGIGEKRLRSFLARHWNEPFVLEIGTHVKIKRRLFEEYLDGMASV